MSDKVITFESVTKEFYLQEDRTLKEVIPRLLRGQGWMRKKQVLNSLSFQVSRGETVGIVGKNGAGKSTIMKLIAGVTYPTEGTVTVEGKVAPLIELEAGFHHELSGYENIFLNAAILGMHKKEVDSQVEAIIDFSGVNEYLHVPLKRYSTGMQMRLAFSIAVHTNAQILLIDEVLAVGDAEFQKKCLKKLKEIKAHSDTTIVFISHDQAAVEAFCDRALLLENGRVITDDLPKNVFKNYAAAQLE